MRRKLNGYNNGKNGKNGKRHSSINSLSHKCAVDKCDGMVGDLSITGLCKKCYSSLYNWSNKKTPAQRIERAKQLKFYDKQQILTTNTVNQPLAVLPGKVKTYRKRTKYKLMKEKL